jgi:hypothetical protein
MVKVVVMVVGRKACMKGGVTSNGSGCDRPAAQLLTGMLLRKPAQAVTATLCSATYLAMWDTNYKRWVSMFTRKNGEICQTRVFLRVLQHLQGRATPVAVECECSSFCLGLHDE